MLVQYIAENFRNNNVNYMHKYMCTGSIRGMAACTLRIVLTQFGYLSCNSRVTSYACSCRNNKWSNFPC